MSRKKIKVLIVDDSFFMRKLLRELLNSDPDIEVVGEAKDGAAAIGEVVRLKPDVVTMDYNMPKMTGAEATKEILERAEHLPTILMVSAYTREGAEETFESLRAGAVDFIMKPSGELSLDIDKIKSEILGKVKMAAKAQVKKFKRLTPRAAREIKKIKRGKAKVIVIGASTGGPPVVEDILSELPTNLPAAVLIVQHMPKYFTESFAKRLDKLSALAVKEAERGDAIDNGDALVAPGGFHMRMRQSDNKIIVQLTEEAPRHGLRPAIDITFESAAEIYGKDAIGIVLTGMGEDGAAGAAAIKNSGGYIIAQDPKTAVVDSMPQAVIEKGLADEVLPPEKIAKRIIELSKQ